MLDEGRSQFVRVATVSDLATGQVLAARLRAEDIDVRLHSEAFGPYPVTVGHLAEAELWVPSDRVDDASHILLDAEVRVAIAPAESGSVPRSGLSVWLRLAALATGIVLTAMWVARLIRVF